MTIVQPTPPRRHVCTRSPSLPPRILIRDRVLSAAQTIIADGRLVTADGIQEACPDLNRTQIFANLHILIDRKLVASDAIAFPEYRPEHGIPSTKEGRKLIAQRIEAMSQLKAAQGAIRAGVVPWMPPRSHGSMAMGLDHRKDSGRRADG